MSGLRFDTAGAQLFAGLAADFCEPLATLFAPDAGDAGQRLTNLGPMAAVLSSEGAIGRVVARLLNRPAHPVRAIAFDKSAARNWALAWHQDRTICVAERHEVAGYANWTCKSSLLHVEPPFALLAGMVTVRLHLDPVDADNAPLLIAPGSHHSGLIPEPQIAALVERCGTHACLAEPGDVWMYATAILHASDRAAQGRRRRVLQVDYSADELPDPLTWGLRRNFARD